MKFKNHPLFIFILLLVMLMISGCQGNDENEEIIRAMPIYPIAKMLGESKNTDTLSNENYAGRIYQSTDTIDKIFSFYKEKMPSDGWKLKGFRNPPDNSITKNLEFEKGSHSVNIDIYPQSVIIIRVYSTKQ